jgi:hypothetical protein
MRHHNLPFRMAFDLARLGFDAWMVASLRTLRLGPGGQAAVLEAQRMIAEKSAASGHASAAPPSSVMNSRRFMGCPPQTGGRRLPYRYVKTLLCITAKLIVERQRWVMNDPEATSALSPFESQLRTLIGAARRSHSFPGRTTLLLCLSDFD